MKQTLIRYSSKYVESKLTRHGVNHSLKILCIRHHTSDQTEISQQHLNNRGGGEIRMGSKSVWDQATKGNTKYN